MIFGAVATLCLGPWVSRAQEPAQPNSADAQAIADLIEQARAHQANGNLPASRRRYEKAFGVSGKSSLAAAAGVMQTCLAAQDLKGAVRMADQIEPHLGVAGLAVTGPAAAADAALAQLTVALVRRQEVRAADLRFEPSLEEVSGTLKKPGKWTKVREQANEKARTALLAALDLEPSRGYALRPLLAATLFDLGRNAEACDVVAHLVVDPSADPLSTQHLSCLCSVPNEQGLSADRPGFQRAVSHSSPAPPAANILELAGTGAATTDLVMVLDETGVVRCSRIVQSSGQAADSALADWILALRYDPATLRGKPVRSKVRFKLQRKKSPNLGSVSTNQRPQRNGPR